MRVGSDGTDPDGPTGDIRVRPADRTRLPWILFGAMLVLLAVTLTITTLNGTFETFVVIAVAMMLGYGTMGALVASRLPSNPLGWLMIAIGLGFVVAGFTTEYVTYAFVTTPGSLPFSKLANWLQSWVGIPTIAGVPLVLLLFPTGRVPSSRWRVLVPTIVALTALLALFIVLTPGPIQTDTPGLRIDNPTGVQALDPYIRALTAGVFLALLAATLVAAVALILRFRRSTGDERQQIRWLAYLVLAALMLLVAAVFSPGALNDILFYTLFACVGIAFPVAIAVAILKYRLYELDLVVRKAVSHSCWWLPSPSSRSWWPWPSRSPCSVSVARP
jgi:MFS family permease